MRNTSELMEIQPFMSRRAIEAFNVRILRWFAGLDIHQRYLMAICPLNQRLRYVLRPVVQAEYCYLIAVVSQLMSRTCGVKWR